MSTNKENKKDKNYWTILNAAIELDIKKGHLKWTLSDLSRKSDITRSLIYYYFGKEKKNILKDAIKLIGEEFVGLTEERMNDWAEGKLYESMIKGRRHFEKAPYLPLFILENRSKPNEIGQALIEIEEAFINKLKNFFPNARPHQIDTIFTIYWGMGFSPRISEEGIKEVIETLLSRLLSQKPQA